MGRLLSLPGRAALIALLAFSAAPARGEEGGQPGFEGSLEFLYRSVELNGSSRKYDEDFNGLDSGGRLSRLSAHWVDLQGDAVDFLQLEASGFGGDPYERASLRLGRRAAYTLRLSHWKQDYIYNLFGLVGDTDASSWNTRRQSSAVDLTIHATENLDLYFGLQEVQRDGSSMFMKNINADLFLLDTPLDQDSRRYHAGARFHIGVVEVFFRQTLDDYNHQITQMSTGNAGLRQTDLATLSRYDWRQNDRGTADLTTVTVSAPLGSRVDLTASLFGTLVGKHVLHSDVALDAEGTSFRGTCSVTASFCDRFTPCSAAPGNTCIADSYSVAGGSSHGQVEVDELLADIDVAVTVARPLEFHLQIRSLDRDLKGRHTRDLDGNGVIDDTEGTVLDATPGSSTRVDSSLTTISGLFELTPIPELRVRAGYRRIDRDVERDGFEFAASDLRNLDLDSSSDDSTLLGFTLQPLRGLKLDADYEEGDISQAFTATAPMEVDRLRARARIEPRDGMRIDLTYMDYRNRNQGIDPRQAADCAPFRTDIDDGCWNSSSEGTTLSAALWHRVAPQFEYWLRWSERDAESIVRSLFDTPVFGAGVNGDSVYDSTSTMWSGEARFKLPGPWSGHFRFQVNDSTGRSEIVAPLVATLTPLDQDYAEVEGGLTYTHANGMYIGGRYRTFRQDDVRKLLDYNGHIFTVVAGLDF